MQRFESFSAAVSSLLKFRVTTEPAAAEVINLLIPTLARCDSLTFESPAECLAYVCWHLADRYGRVQHVLDHLAKAGHLPIRRRPVALLEVGAGPAPAAYAVADYYASLADWCDQSAQPVRPAPVGVPATLDRGPAWGRVVHHLSEMVLMQDDDPDGVARTFGTSFADLRGFSVRRLHNQGIAWAAASAQREAERADEYLGDGEARELAIAYGGYPPSAYDLVVMCNFLTQPEMTEDLATELTDLTGSLTPGGVLLVLGSATARYDEVYAAMDRLAAGCAGHPLQRVLTDVETLPAQASPVAEKLVVRGLVRDLSALRDRSPDVFEEVRKQFPPDVRPLDPEQIKLPRFRLRAYKREGDRAFSRREKRRMARRRTER